MPRPPKPRWSKSRRRWYANIGDPGPDGRAREVFAPAGIAEGDDGRAWDWFRAEAARRAPRAAGADLSVEDLVELYLLWAEGRVAEGRLSKEHYDGKGFHLTKLADAFGARPAGSLEAGDVTRFLEGLARVHAPNYVANIGASVAAAYNWAVRAKHLPASPVAGFETPAVPRSGERFAERAEAAAFLRHWLRRHDRATVAGRYDRLTLLMARALVRTGARPKELCRLRWADLRWAGGTTTAGHAFAKAVLPARREDGAAGHKTAHATGKPRTIYLTPALTRALARVKGRPWAHPVYVFVHGKGRGGRGAGEPWESGSRLSRKVLVVRRELIARQGGIRARLAAGAEVAPWEARLAAVAVRDSGENRLTNYRFRHTAASTLLMMGVDVPTVAELLGTSPDMIYRTYGHILDGHLAAAAEKLGRGRRSTG